ncbi:MAG: hypothetical protein AB9869_19245 [Verrucomicrobiia bacterium]
MKFTLALVVYLLMGLVLGWGILLVMKGSYWFLIAGLIAYLIAFARFGCTGHE